MTDEECIGKCDSLSGKCVPGKKFIQQVNFIASEYTYRELSALTEPLIRNPATYSCTNLWLHCHSLDVM